MKVITCASFNGSGSSAVTDLFAEYSCVQSNTDYEFRFIHDPDGISDLEFHLCQCHNRENSGHALKRFHRLSKFNNAKINSQYPEVFHGQYLPMTEEYVKNLTDFSYKGWWFFDLYDKGFFSYHLLQCANHLLGKLGIRILNKEKIICSHPSVEKFISETRNYMHKLLVAANPDNKEYVEFDQLVPSQNIGRTLRYFKDDVYVVIVDRDPRDLYCSFRFIYKENPINFKTVGDFCKWFRYIRTSGNPEPDSDRILHIHFEDIIYHYDETVSKLESFAGIDPATHTTPFSRLNPKRSAVNTMMFRRYSNISEDIEFIEKELPEYLYDFSKVTIDDVAGFEPAGSQKAY